MNVVDPQERTALHYACSAGKSEAITLLLQFYPNNKDARTKGGNTPLMQAV